MFKKTILTPDGIREFAENINTGHIYTLYGSCLDSEKQASPGEYYYRFYAAIAKDMCGGDFGIDTLTGAVGNTGLIMRTMVDFMTERLMKNGNLEPDYLAYIMTLTAKNSANNVLDEPTKKNAEINNAVIINWSLAETAAKVICSLKL